MSHHCKIEFYFKRKDVEELLKTNPDANGLIIRQEIKPRRKADGKTFENVTSITAYARGKNASKKIEAELDPGDCIDGCPFPPGCSGDSDDDDD